MEFRVLSSLRGKVNEEEFLTIITSLSLLEFEDSNNIEIILKSGEDAGESFLKKTSQIVVELKVELPWFMDCFENTVNKIDSATLSSVLFESLEYFKKYKPNVVLTNFIENHVEYFGKIAGVHSTPMDVNGLALQILDVQPNESYLEPTAGFGNALNHLLINNPEQEIFAQDISGFASDIIKIRAILANASNTTVQTDDVLVNPQYVKSGKLQKFDVVYSDAPFSMSTDSTDFYDTDSYNRYNYGQSPKSRADWAFISNGISSLNENGRALFVVAQGALFRGGKEATIRKNIIELDLIESVINLPSNLLDNTAIPISMIIINKNKSDKMKNVIRMVEAEEFFTKKRRDKYLSVENINQILELMKYGNQEQNVALVKKSELEEYSLNVKRYVMLDQIIQDKVIGNVVVKAEEIEKLDTFQLQEKAEIIRGVNLTKTTDKNQYKVIKISDINEEGHIDFEKLSIANFSDNTKTEKYMVRKGDLIITTRGSTIKTSVIKKDIENVLVTQNLAVIRVNKEINEDWLDFYLNSPIGIFEIEKRLIGETVQSLLHTAIGEINIPKISYETQIDIIQKYTQKTNEIKNKIKELEQSIVHEKEKALEKMSLNKTFKKITD